MYDRLDLQQAFDNIDKQVLIEKLSTFGIRDQALDWLVNYLTDRQKIVEIEHFPG